MPVLIKSKKVRQGRPTPPLTPSKKKKPLLPTDHEQLHPHKKIFGLGEEKVNAIIASMVRGDKLVEIAKTIKQEWGALSDVSDSALYQMLSRFRKEQVDGKLLYLQTTDYGKQAFDRLAKEVDVVENLSRLVQIQQERLSKLYLREQTRPILMDQVRFEIQTLGSLYKQLGEMQMDLGILRRAPKEVTGSLEVAVTNAQRKLEDALDRDKNVEEALKSAFRVIEGAFEG